MNLLRDMAGDGYPCDYLVARVRARRTMLTRDWRGAPARGRIREASDEVIWDGLLQELEWLYLQMDRGMRARLAPVFALFEVKTLVLCLRNGLAGRREEVERLLRHSLLADGVKRALRMSQDTTSALGALAAAAQPVLGDASVLKEACTTGGLKEVETVLMRRYLSWVVAGRTVPAVRAFFAAFIDLRNLVMLYKKLRWQINEEPAYIPGGSIGDDRLREAGSGRPRGGLDVLLREVIGRAAPLPAAGDTALESLLLGDMTRRLHAAAVADGDEGLLLDYAWRLYVEARNRAVVLHAGGLYPETLARELIA